MLAYLGMNLEHSSPGTIFVVAYFKYMELILSSSVFCLNHNFQHCIKF